MVMEMGKKPREKPGASFVRRSYRGWASVTSGLRARALCNDVRVLVDSRFDGPCGYSQEATY